MKYIYMAIDLNDNELPIAVADTAGELAEMLGVTRNTVYTSMAQAKRVHCRSRYIKVEVTDE